MWVNSFFTSRINRTSSHFNGRFEFSLLTIPNKFHENFCEGLDLLSVFLLESRDYKNLDLAKFDPGPFSDSNQKEKYG